MMDEAELQEVLDLLEHADEAWINDNQGHHYPLNDDQYAEWERDRARFHDLITRLVAAQREAVT